MPKITAGKAALAALIVAILYEQGGIAKLGASLILLSVLIVRPNKDQPSVLEGLLGYLNKNLLGG